MCYPTSVIPKDTEAVVRELAAQLHPPAQPFQVLDTVQARLEAAATRAFAEGRISQSTAKQHIANGLKGKYDEAHSRATTDYLNIKVDPFRALEHGLQLAEREGTITAAQAAELRGRTLGEKQITEILKDLRSKTTVTVQREAAAATRPAWLKRVDEVKDLFERRAGLGRGGVPSEAQLRRAGDALQTELRRRIEASPFKASKTLEAAKQGYQEAIDEYRRASFVSLDERRRLQEAVSAASNVVEEIESAERMAHNAQQVKGLLSEVREMGSTFKHQVVRGGDKKAVEALNQLSDLLPSEWVEKSAPYGRLRVKKVVRGHYSHNREWNGSEFISEFYVSGSNQTGLNDVAMHEFGHRMEAIDWNIREAEAEFYQRRTRGEALTEIYKGSGEMGYKDHFGSHYIGKDYGGGAYEVLSMGMQDLYGKRKYILEDEDMTSFILGVLAIL